MRVTKTYLTQVIEEELERYLDEVNPLRNEKGHFASWDTAKSYSLSTAKRNKYAPNSRDGKFKVTGNQKLKPQYGLADCGRTDVRDASPIPKKWHCAKYPKRYGVAQKQNNNNIKILNITTKQPMGSSETARWKSDRGRKKKLFPGYDDLKRLSNLIPEVELNNLIVELGIDDLEEQNANQIQCSQECNNLAWKRFILTLRQIKAAEKGE